MYRFVASSRQETELLGQIQNRGNGPGENGPRHSNPNPDVSRRGTNHPGPR